ncbi:MAG: hypothetical protein HKN36_12630 [Hellea sp.]|nr:hypothetical protein [Hellea sp.]
MKTKFLLTFFVAFVVNFISVEAGEMEDVENNEMSAISIGLDGYFDSDSNAKFIFKNVETGELFKSNRTKGFYSFQKYYQATMSESEIAQIENDIDRQMQMMFHRKAADYNPAKDTPSIVYVPAGTYRLVSMEGITTNAYFKPKNIEAEKIDVWFNPIVVKEGEIIHLGSLLVTNPIKVMNSNSVDLRDKTGYFFSKKRKDYIRDVNLPVVGVRDDSEDVAAFILKKYPSLMSHLTVDAGKTRIDPAEFQNRWSKLNIDYENTSEEELRKYFDEIVLSFMAVDDQ